MANPNQTTSTALPRIPISPNPTNGSFTISFISIGATHDVEVADVLGKIVYRKTEISDPTLVIDLSDQPKGVYFVKCIEGDQVSIQRVVLQ